MQHIFECLIDSFLENKVGLAEDFLSIALAAHLKENLMSLHSDHQMLAARIGNNELLAQDNLVRTDRIRWLDPLHKDPHELLFFELMDRFVVYLNSTCYAGITGYEFHYALYEKGSFYKKHLDQFRSDKSRAFSMIMYLNTNWQLDDGGELVIHHEEQVQVIAPTNGKCVFFRSNELPHEVLVTQQPRMSITGWLKVS